MAGYATAFRITGAAVKALNERGKVKAIAISHPHFFSAVAEWSKALGDIPIFGKDAAQAAPESACCAPKSATPAAAKCCAPA